MTRLWGLFIDGERKLPFAAWPVSKVPAYVSSLMTDHAMLGHKVRLVPVAYEWKPSANRMLREGRF